MKNTLYKKARLIKYKTNVIFNLVIKSPLGPLLHGWLLNESMNQSNSPINKIIYIKNNFSINVFDERQRLYNWQVQNKEIQFKQFTQFKQHSNKSTQ